MTEHRGIYVQFDRNVPAKCELTTPPMDKNTPLTIRNVITDFRRGLVIIGCLHHNCESKNNCDLYKAANPIPTQQ